jgi:hypothetical protein
MQILRATEIISAVSAVVTVVGLVLFRYVWRRNKRLQEP